MYPFYSNITHTQKSTFLNAYDCSNKYDLSTFYPDFWKLKIIQIHFLTTKEKNNCQKLKSKAKANLKAKWCYKENIHKIIYKGILCTVCYIQGVGILLAECQNLKVKSKSKSKSKIRLERRCKTNSIQIYLILLISIKIIGYIKSGSLTCRMVIVW